MSWLPQGTVLGEFSLVETYVYYDGPRLFSARSTTDQLYLVLWASEDEELGDRWFYLPVSSARLNMIKSGALPLRDAFLIPESAVYVATLPHAEGVADSVHMLNITSLNDSHLPAPGFVLNVPTETQPKAPSVDQIELQAIQESRARLHLRVAFPRFLRTEAPARIVGELLVLTQNVYDNIGLAMLIDDPPQRGRIPAEISEATQADLVGLSAASFVLELAASQSDDLLGESTFSRITAQLLALLDTSIERSALQEQLGRLRPRGAKSFRRFVEGLVATGGDISLIGAASATPATLRELTHERLETLRALLHHLVPDDTREVRGRMRLYRADMERKQFGLLDELRGERYEGQISQRALAQVDHAEVNDIYDVVITALGQFDEMVGERKPAYILEQLVRADENSSSWSEIIVPDDDDEWRRQA